MTQVLSKKVALKYSLRGRQKKRGFTELRTYKVVTSKYSNTTSMIMKSCFRGMSIFQHATSIHPQLGHKLMHVVSHPVVKNL